QKVARRVWLFPRILDVGDEARHEQEVARSVAERLVRDVDALGHGIARHWRHTHSLRRGMRTCARAPGDAPVAGRRRACVLSDSRARMYGSRSQMNPNRGSKCR